MQNNSTQDNINNHLLRLSKKEVYGIPSWKLLYKVVQELKHDYSVDNSEYVSQLYWAIKDLFSLDYTAVVKVIGIDEAVHSVTQVCTRHYVNKVGSEKQPPVVTVYDERRFNALYAGKPLEHFNQNPVTFESIKLNKYAKERSLAKSLEDEEDGSYDPINWILDGTDKIERKIDNLFRPVIDVEWPRTTFEKFIEKCKPTPPPPGRDKPVYASFEDLFINPADIEPCINALRWYRPEEPILGDGRNWTGSRKDRGLLVAWIERMETMNPQKIRPLTDRKKLVKLLNGYFENLNMGAAARVFDNPVNPDARNSFTSLIPQ